MTWTFLHQAVRRLEGRSDPATLQAVTNQDPTAGAQYEAAHRAAQAIIDSGALADGTGAETYHVTLQGHAGGPEERFVNVAVRRGPDKEAESVAAAEPVVGATEAAVSQEQPQEQQDQERNQREAPAVEQGEQQASQEQQGQQSSAFDDQGSTPADTIPDAL